MFIMHILKLKFLLAIGLLMIASSSSARQSNNNITTVSTYTYTVPYRFLKIEQLAKQADVSIIDLCKLNKGVNSSSVFKEKQQVYIPILKVTVDDFYMTDTDIMKKYSVNKSSICLLNNCKAQYQEGEYVNIPLNDKTRHLQSSSNNGDINNQTSNSRENSNTRSYESKRTRSNTTSHANPNTVSESYSPKNGNIIVLIAHGEGRTKEEATKIALRSALEQTYGTFVSANTIVLNDDIVKDEIISLSRGNIERYEEVSCVDLKNGNKVVTVKAAVSIDKLTSYAKSKGMTTELAGATLAMNVKIYELNKQNELIAFNHMLEQAYKIADSGIYDFTIKRTFVKQYKGKMTSFIDVDYIPNDNYMKLIEFLEKSIKSISVPKNEYNELKKLNITLYITNFDKDNPLKKEKGYERIGGKFNDNIYTRNDIYTALGKYDQLILYIKNQASNFEIIDNIGNSISSGTIKRANLISQKSQDDINILHSEYGEYKTLTGSWNLPQTYCIGYSIEEISKVTGYKISPKN